MRIPLYMRGPGIKPGTVRGEMAMNIDIAPTLLSMAGIEVPNTCDGKNLYELIRSLLMHLFAKYSSLQPFSGRRRP